MTLIKNNNEYKSIIDCRFVLFCSGHQICLFKTKLLQNSGLSMQLGQVVGLKFYHIFKI